jgi:hypothetical protein
MMWRKTRMYHIWDDDPRISLDIGSVSIIETLSLWKESRELIHRISTKNAVI